MTLLTQLKSQLPALAAVIALASAGAVFAAEKTDPGARQNTSISSVKTGETKAFFYKQATILDRQQHKHLKFKPPADTRFAEHAQAVPLVDVEFPEAALEYPIVFSRLEGGAWFALAVTGLVDGQNLFIDKNGKWSGRYVPASVRRYPFILAESGSDQLQVAIDLAYAGFGTRGETLFDEAGEPSPVLKSALALLTDFQQRTISTQAFIEHLDQAGLLTNANLQVKSGDGRVANLSGVWVVDEAKLRDLPDGKITAWFRSGELALVHAHMLSLRNLLPLLDRQKSAKSGKAGT